MDRRQAGKRKNKIKWRRKKKKKKQTQKSPLFSRNSLLLISTHGDCCWLKGRWRRFVRGSLYSAQVFFLSRSRFLKTLLRPEKMWSAAAERKLPVSDLKSFHLLSGSDVIARPRNPPPPTSSASPTTSPRLLRTRSGN